MNDTSGADQAPPAAEPLMQMIIGYWVSQVVGAAARFSLADHLAAGPSQAARWAEAEGLDPDAAARFLRACAALGLVTVDAAAGTVAGTPLLAGLRRDAPGSLRGLAVALAAPGHWLPWGRLDAALRTGEAQAVATLGVPIFEHYRRTPDEGAAFTEAMTGLTAAVAAEAARLIDMAGVAVAVDVGGAAGALLLALLAAHPGLRGIVCDLPAVAAQATAAAERAGLADRMDAAPGDFFSEVPAGDLMLLKFILHDWDDAACLRILGNCRRALRPGGRIAVIELVLDDHGAPGLAPLMDLNMMVVASGRERRFADYDRLLRAAGFGPARLIPTRTAMSIIEATADGTAG